MAIADSIQNIRFISETAVRAYDALVQKGLWPRARRTQSPLGALALVGLGAAVGAGVALALAPSAGSDLRSSLGETLRKLGNDWLGGLGLTPQVSPEGARAEAAGSKEGESKDAEPSETGSTDTHKNGVGRRKQAQHGASRASLAKGPPGPPAPASRGAHLRPTTAVGEAEHAGERRLAAAGQLVERGDGDAARPVVDPHGRRPEPAEDAVPREGAARRRRPRR